MTSEELKQYDGQSGRKAYVAYKGKVYDVTSSEFWSQGEHQGLHFAGADLTEAMQDAPHGEEVFSDFEIVAELEQPVQPVQATVPETATGDETPDCKTRLRTWYQTYHPHPMTVHFPIALHLFAAGMDLLFLSNPKAAYALSVFYTFLIATVGGLIAMIPGILSWWINYNFSWSRPFAVKVILSTVSLTLGIVAILIHWEDPSIVYTFTTESVIYHAIVLLTGVMVIIIGYYGGKLTWPAHGNTPTREPEREVSTPAQAHPAKTIDAASASLEAVSYPTAAFDPPEQSGNDCSILIGGAAGTGIQSLETILSDAFRRCGYYLFSTKEYMSRVRGGSNTTLIRFGDRPLSAPCWHVDLCVAIDAAALDHVAPRCNAETVKIADESVAEAHDDVIAVPMKKSAAEAGNARLANTFAAGVVFGLLRLPEAPLLQSIAALFDAEQFEGNHTAVNKGIAFGTTLDRTLLPPLPKPVPGSVEPLHLMNGTTAAGFGFLTGGCNFVTSYPMSPSTGVLTFMASMSRHFDILVEQSEDEIAALNMVLGGWYAGARALTTTSGGGFALMCETLSLSGMSETPAVIYLAQRPGPATGLPTRTEQGDLDFVTHAGHGDFRRVVLAPGSLQECIDMGYLAFELADRFQIPVILLSDQYLADSMAMTRKVDFSTYEQRRYITPTDPDYRRYADAEDGISSRGIPGNGEGLVCATSDEHDERGQITEDYRVREQMLSKRSRKAERVVTEALEPEIIGDGEIAVVGWGSTKGSVAEALQRLDDARLFHVHFSWVHPLNPDNLAPLSRAKAVIAVENNGTGQFASQLELAGITVTKRILQANGFPFFADQLDAMIAETVKELS